MPGLLALCRHAGSSGVFVCLGGAGDSKPPGRLRRTGGFFPLSEVHRGLIGTAWTVFTGSKPEPMQVEILGVLRGARGPGHDMILAQLHGAKPEYTGVVAGMSGSPVYIGNKLLGSLSYRIGQFSKDPIAGITPIEADAGSARPARRSRRRRCKWLRLIRRQPSRGRHDLPGHGDAAGDERIQAGGDAACGSRKWPEPAWRWWRPAAEAVVPFPATPDWMERFLNRPLASVVPGSAVSAQLVRGDLEIAATCTVTYIDPKQLLACGHPILQAGPVSMPMTTADVVATLASPLNAFKIVNTGATIGAFTQDRDAAIRGVLGAKAHMIPVHVAIHAAGTERTGS